MSAKDGRAIAATRDQVEMVCVAAEAWAQWKLCMRRAGSEDAIEYVEQIRHINAKLRADYS